MVVAIAQSSPEPGDVAENARRAASTIASAAEAEARLLLFPELSLTSYDLACLADPATWITVDDPRLDVVREASRVHGVTTVVGAAHRRQDGGALLASLALSPEGGVDVVGKRFLHGAERDLFQPGAATPTCGSTAGRSLSLSASTRRFPGTRRTRPSAAPTFTPFPPCTRSTSSDAWTSTSRPARWIIGCTPSPPTWPAAAPAGTHAVAAEHGTQTVAA
jgi:predicted amidohydrolase